MSFVAVAVGGGALLGGVVSAVGANAAADTQASAANNAANLQANTAQNSLEFQGNSLNTEIANQQPWYQSGEGALSQLDALLGITPGAPAQGVQVPGMPGSTPSTATNTSAYAGPYAGPAGDTSRVPMASQTPGVQASPPALTATAGGQFQAAAPGTTAVDANGNPVGGASSSSPLMQPWNQTFQAPTAVTEQNDPGYQFRLQQGEKALDMGAAASGNLLTGGTANAEQQYGQNYASNEYSNVYNRALQDYSTNYNTFEANQANQYNRLASMAGVGQTTASQINNNISSGTTTAASTMGSAANAIGANINNAAAATASGYVGGANAISNGITGMGNTVSQYNLLQQLQNQNGGGVQTPNFGSSINYGVDPSTGGYVTG